MCFLFWKKKKVKEETKVEETKVEETKVEEKVEPETVAVEAPAEGEKEVKTEAVSISARTEIKS